MPMPMAMPIATLMAIPMHAHRNTFFAVCGGTLLANFDLLDFAASARVGVSVGRRVASRRGALCTLAKVKPVFLAPLLPILDVLLLRCQFGSPLILYPVPATLLQRSRR